MQINDVILLTYAKKEEIKIKKIGEKIRLLLLPNSNCYVII